MRGCERLDDILAALRDEPVPFSSVRSGVMAEVRRGRRSMWWIYPVAATLFAMSFLWAPRHRNEALVAPSVHASAPVNLVRAVSRPVRMVAPESESFTVKMLTDDPGVVIYWVVGRRRRIVMKNLILFLTVVAGMSAQDTTRVFELKYVDPGALKNLLAAFPVSTSIVNSLHMITVRGNKEAVDAATEAIRAAEGADPSEVAPVFQQLRALFPHKSCQVAESFFLRGRRPER